MCRGPFGGPACPLIFRKENMGYNETPIYKELLWNSL